MHTYLIFLAFGWIRVVIMKIGHLPILWKLFIFLERTRNFSKMSVKYFSIFENLIYFSKLNFDSSLIDKKSAPGALGSRWAALAIFFATSNFDLKYFCSLLTYKDAQYFIWKIWFISVWRQKFMGHDMAFYMSYVGSNYLSFISYRGLC